MRSQGLLKSSVITGAALRPLFSVINKSIKNVDSISINNVRNQIIKASEEIEKFKQYANLPPLYGVGGTAIGGYEPLVLPDAPYLTPMKGGSGYCLVLDLDETLVHYFEVGSEGTFLVRPGCDQFLKEMAEIYEVVIFTAAMQDVSFIHLYFNFLPLVRRLGPQPSRQGKENQVQTLQIACSATRSCLCKGPVQNRKRPEQDYHCR